MKKQMLKIVAVLAMSCCLACLAVACQAAPVTKTADGLWQYTVVEDKDDNGATFKTVTLDAYLGDAAAVVVPNVIDVDGDLIPVTKIGDGAFMKIADKSGKWRDRDTYTKNTVLKTVVVSEGVTSIGNMAFYLCSELTDVVLPQSLTSISDFAFFGCTALTEITIPKNVSSIGAYSFRACSALTRVNVMAEEVLPDLGDKAFYLVNEKSSKDDQYYINPALKIYVPTGAYHLYDADKIEQERRETKKNNHRYWSDYIQAGCLQVIA